MDSISDVVLIIESEDHMQTLLYKFCIEANKYCENIKRKNKVDCNWKVQCKLDMEQVMSAVWVVKDGEIFN